MRTLDLHRKTCRTREDLSYGYLDCCHDCDRVVRCALGSVFHRVHPSREGAWTHVVHVVETKGALRYRAGYRISANSTWRRRCAWCSLLIAPIHTGGFKPV